MLRSPAEPPSFSDVGKSSPLCEELGVDFIIGAPNGLVGVQRKRIGDLIASIHDDRLARETLMRDRLWLSILLIEGRPKITYNGDILTGGRARFTIDQLRGVLLSARLEGWWVDYTENTQDTIRYLHSLERWAKKPSHRSLHTRSKPPRNAWGKRKSQSQASWALQSVDGLSSELADRIVDASTGQPLVLTMGKDDLLTIEGIGPKRVEKLWEVFGQEEEGE